MCAVENFGRVRQPGKVLLYQEISKFTIHPQSRKPMPVWLSPTKRTPRCVNYVYITLTLCTLCMRIREKRRSHQINSSAKNVAAVQSTCLLPHGAKTHDPQCFSSEGKAAEPLFCPLPASHGVVSRRDTPRHAEHKAQHQLCYCCCRVKISRSRAFTQRVVCCVLP